MTLKPLYDNIIVKQLKEEEVTKSGIVLPDTINKEKPQQGEVIAIGPGKKDNNGKIVEMSVKVGDKILFNRYSPNEIKIDDEEYLVMRESDVLAIIE
ncbi:MAG TPA: co-chaperone GroES [bacterium]|nr:co-chaperone GroES [bacterium]HPO11219.1 co-chaperone GroES [bacterium]HQL12139.1 co-chaperone GroES [bacterium]